MTSSALPLVSKPVEGTTALDHELERRVRIFLANRHVPDLMRLKVQVENGQVTMQGSVRSFYHKQLVQDCCRRVAGVRGFVDRVNVA